jgi:hypothetical protein
LMKETCSNPAYTSSNEEKGQKREPDNRTSIQLY